MKVLVVGGGGREHAICWALKKSPKVTELFCAPGNARHQRHRHLCAIGATDLDAMVAWAKENAMDLVMVAPRRSPRPGHGGRHGSRWHQGLRPSQ